LFEGETTDAADEATEQAATRNQANRSTHSLPESTSFSGNGLLTIRNVLLMLAFRFSFHGS